MYDKELNAFVFLDADKPKIVVDRVKSKEESIYEDISQAVASYRNGFSHIIVDDGCYIIVNGNQISSHIDKESLAVIALLPKDARDCYKHLDQVPPPEAVEQQGLGITVNYKD